MKLLLSVSLFLTSLAQAQSLLEQQARIQGVTMSAENMDRDAENDTVDVEGNVQIIYKDQHLKADKARINFRAKSIEAFGNVLVTTPQAHIAGHQVIMDYESNTGLIIDGYVQSGNVLFEGTRINKLSETEYIADNARYTTCTTCPEAWSFSGSKIRADIGGYAYIKSSVLKFASIPVFWLPYLVVPLKSDRQSGFLTPGFGDSSDGGFETDLTYYWAKSRSDDASITVKNYALRGWKGLLNYRYVLNESSQGEMDVGFLQDRVFGSDARLNKFRPLQTQNEALDRYFLRYNHYYDMPEGYVHRLQLNNASDLQYPKDFPKETGNHGDTAMENRMSITKNTENQHYSMDMSYYKNLMQSNPLAGNDDAVHRLPELRFSQVQTRLGKSDYLYSMDLDYTNFYRSQFSYDDLNSGFKAGSNNDRWVNSNCGTKDWEKDPTCTPVRDGTYDSGKDLIRTGQRLDFRPTIYRPFKVNNFELLPKLSYQETQYLFPVGQDSRNIRRLLRADLSARTTFSRIYGDFNSLQSERIKHEVQPEVAITAIPWIHHPQHEFFGSQSNDISYSSQSNISDADLNGPAGLQFDYSDRLVNRRLLTFGFSNKLTRKYWKEGAPVYLQFLNWRLAQSYDSYLAEKNPNGQPLSDLSSELQLTLAPFDIYQTSNYYHYQRVTNTSTRVRITSDKGDYFQIEHALLYNISPGQEVDILGRTEEYTYTVKKTAKWVDLLGKIIYDQSPAAQKIKSWGYGVQLKPPGDCFAINFIQYRITGGSQVTNAYASFMWDGTNKAPSDDILRDIGF